MFFELKSSDKPAFITPDGEVVTYSAAAQEVAALGSSLEPGKLAFCLCENTVASVIGYLACLNHHTVPLLLDRKIDRQLLEELLRIYTPAFLYVPTEEAGDFAGYETKTTHRHYSLLERKEAVDVNLYEELALLLTTSGSVGSPKLVRQSFKNIQANAESIASYLELTEDERPITTLPMNYTYGLSIINSHLQVQAPILLTTDSMSMKAFWDFFKEQKATSFGGVPFTYEMLKKIRFFKMELPSLRYMTQAGGKLSPELHREFAIWCRERGKKFIVMYGQTEATARMAYLPAEFSVEKYGSMGRAIPGGRFTLIDVDGNEITEPDIVGELVYMGENVTLGYAEKAADLAGGDERGGRLVTGDMAKRDADGFYYIVGRKKRFLKVFGNRVNLDEIDQLVKGNFEVDCASTGVDDHMKTYITDPDKTTEIRKWLSAKTHLSETAFEVLYIPEIPKNESGKVVYRALEES